MNHCVSLSLNNMKYSVHLHAFYSPRTAIRMFTPRRDQLVICRQYFYITKQLPLSGCRQELHCSPQNASSSCRKNDSDTSAALSFHRVSTVCCCCAFRYGSVYCWTACFCALSRYVKCGSATRVSENISSCFPGTGPSTNTCMNWKWSQVHCVTPGQQTY
jgi:hypothetical protein